MALPPIYIEISKRGYRKSEPEEAQRETSQMLAKVFAALRDESISKGDIASEVCVPAEELDQLVFGLALTGLIGGGNGRGSQGSRPSFAS